MTWPPDYVSEFQSRQKRLVKMRKKPHLIFGAKHYYADKPIEFIQHWCVTYDPRNATSDVPTTMPFILFPRQQELVEFICELINTQESGLIEKTRDMGATWVCAAVSVWAWLFIPGVAIGWGSRKQDLVDNSDDPDSIFEKMRITLDKLPAFFLPEGYDRKTHQTFLKIINPENGSTITGEAGDNIGRGGRKTMYFVDEAAHIERPEKIDAALSANTNVQIDISSVHGTTNVFYKRRQAGEIWEPGKKIPKGIVRIFIMDWRDHPAKDQEWYDRGKAKSEREGLGHLFAQEVQRDYAAAVEGVVIPSKHVQAAIDAHLSLAVDIGMKMAGLDVADEGVGGDKNCYVMRKGILLQRVEIWGGPDTGKSTRKASTFMKEDQCQTVQYDCIGVGAGVTAESNRLQAAQLKRKHPLVQNFIAWSAAAKPRFPEKRIISGDRTAPKNKDFYNNLKAQGWWQLKLRFEKTYKVITEGADFDPSELISIPSTIDNFHQLVTELSQPTYSTNGAGRVVIDKAPDGAKSPDAADAIMMCYWPIVKRRVKT